MRYSAVKVSVLLENTFYQTLNFKVYGLVDVCIFLFFRNKD